ncbi:MAG TPA: hypothetical protein VEY71_04945 [Chitinophagales bacterium]|nr:hypothetical protein [Chitinophagales bacterium]
MHFLTPIVLFAFTFHGAVHSQSPTDNPLAPCKYTIGIEYERFRLCDDYDTILVYDSDGEVLGDSAVWLTTNDLFNPMFAKTLHKFRTIEIFAFPKRPVKIDSAELIIDHKGTPTHFILTKNKLTRIQRNAMRTVVAGDQIKLIGRTLLDKGEVVTVPFVIRIEVH